MNFKKLVISSLCAAILGIATFTSNCSATISPNQLALGGLLCGWVASNKAIN